MWLLKCFITCLVTGGLHLLVRDILDGVYITHLVSEPKLIFLGSLISVLATFNNGMTNSCGCLLLMLCNTSKGMIPVGNCLSKLILNMLLVFKFRDVCIEIHMIDLLCNVHCPLVLLTALVQLGLY